MDQSTPIQPYSWQLVLKEKVIRLESETLPGFVLKVGMANELMNRFAYSWYVPISRVCFYEVDRVAIISYAQLESIQAQHLISILDLSAKTTMIHQPESMVVRIPQSETISSRGLSLHEVMKYYEFVLQIFYSTNNLQITLLSVNANSPTSSSKPHWQITRFAPASWCYTQLEKCIQGRKCSCVRDVVHIKNKTIRNPGWQIDKEFKNHSMLSMVPEMYVLYIIQSSTSEPWISFLLGHAWWKSSAGLLDELDLVSEVPFKLWHLLSLLRWKLPCSILFECSTFGKTVF